jgi:hypothetical protein
MLRFWSATAKSLAWAQPLMLRPPILMDRLVDRMSVLKHRGRKHGALTLASDSCERFFSS